MDDSSRDDRRGVPFGSRLAGKVIKSEAADGAAPEKAQASAPRRPAVLNAEEYDAHSAAKQIIAEAQKKAEEIKTEARAYRDEVFAQARQEAQADVEARSAEELARAKLQAGQLLAESEHDIADLALRIAAKIIGRDLERDSDVVLEIVATTVEAARSSKAMVLRVHPDDGKLLREKRPRLMELVGRAIDIAIRDDGDVEKGGCIIQTDFGVIDGQLKTQFEMLRNVLMPAETKKEKS